VAGRRRFNDSERAALYLAAEGRCTECGTPLEPGWHADHVDPWSRSHNTDVINGQALCPPCNLRKGNRVARQLLAWQQDALKRYQTAGASGQPPGRFLIAAFPGMGKTEAASAIAASTGRFVIVLAAQADTLSPWRATLHGRGLCPAAEVTKDAVSRTCASCGKQVLAAVMTYDFAAANPHVIARLLAERGPALLICDEVHHLRHERAWSAPLVAAKPYINAVLALSATPYRTDEEPVPFVHTAGPWTREPSLLPERCVVDYNYGRALTQKPAPVTRAIFERYDADVTWLEGEGDDETEVSAVLSRETRKDVVRKARRHALNTKGAWLPAVLQDADAILGRIRATDNRGGGLIICRDTDHAVAVADLLVRMTSGPVTVYTQDYSTRQHRVGAGRRNCTACGEMLDPAVTFGRECPGCKNPETRRAGGESGDVKASYESGDSKWMVTVRKVSEGVDIQRLRVLVYATVTRTRLFFIQALGRVIRVRRDLAPGVDQTAWVYIPDDEEMQGYAQEVENDIADAEIAAYEEDDDSDPGDGHGNGGGGTGRAGRFISAQPEYSGSTAGGVAHEPELMALAVELDEPPHETLRMLRKLRDSGHLNLDGTAAPSSSASQNTAFDPAAMLKVAVAEKDAAAKSWAGLRRSRGDFSDYTQAIRACHRECGELFGVWAENADVTVEQVQKATRHVRERIKEMRRGN
jgi:superfamily II DNA or RNA helicase